jgi:hypothetical protein
MKKSFLLMIFVALLLGCNNEEVLEFDNANIKAEITSKDDVKSSKSITLGFNLVFTGNYDYMGPDEAKCGSFPPMVNVINTGEGTGTHFGKMTSHFDFCVDLRDSSYPNGFEEAYFMDENGDKLFVYVEGFVLGGRVPGMPNYASSYFKDPFVITGGTGRFEGATGSGMTNDYNSNKDDYSHHHWTGKITLLKN